MITLNTNYFEKNIKVFVSSANKSKVSYGRQGLHIKLFVSLNENKAINI